MAKVSGNSGRSGAAMRNRRKLVIVANRMPVKKVRRGSRSTWETSPGGLVAALAPVLKEREGAWIGWDGTMSGRRANPFTHDGIAIRPLALNKDEYERFYAGFSNSTLWPL